MGEDAMYFLDCYSYMFSSGHAFPAASFGPALFSEVQRLQRRLATQFDRSEIVRTTKSRSPLPKPNWP